jgi:hypothetical protein
MREAKGGKTNYGRWGFEKKTDQSGISHEAAGRENGYVATHRKRLRRALVANQFAGVRSQQAVGVRKEVGTIWCKIAGKEDGGVRRRRIDYFNRRGNVDRG